MGLWDALGAAFGNGAVTPTIARTDIETALTGRGYVKGSYVTVMEPRYSRDQILTMSVDHALQGVGLAVRPATRQTLDPSRWTSVVDNALRYAQGLAQQTVPRQELSIAERGF